MPRGKLLASEEEEFADAYRYMACWQSYNSEKINGSRTLVNNYVNLAKDYGRSCKLTKKQHSLLVRTATKN